MVKNELKEFPVSVGQKINSLTLVERLPNESVFKCDCGNIKRIPIGQVFRGIIKSCGCLRMFYGKKTRFGNGYEYKKYQTSHGYISSNKGYVHRLVMEKELTKYPKPSEMEVHHINGNKSDNRKENLMVVDRKTHRRLEQGWNLIDNKWFKTCSNCKKEFEVNTDNFYQRKTGKYINWCKKCSLLNVKMRRGRKLSPDRSGN